MPNILDRDNKIARTSLLGSPSYCTLPLPDYFDFSDILSKVSKHLADNPLHPDTKKNKKASTDNDEKPSVRSIESPNHTIYANKDGHYAWRPLTLINPVLYVNLVHTLTEKKNWDTIRTRFQDLQKDPRIECLSIPNPLDKASLQHEAAIRDYWKYFEQRSIELSAEYEYLASTDITDCYGSIYTHSVAWALHGKKEAKEQRCNQSLLGNKIDRMLQDMNNGQTNGIPQGNMVSDLIAELILAYGDHLLTERIGPNGSSNIDPDWRILRYRDDFRIFTHSKKQAHNLLLELMIVLQGLNLKLNSSKTYISSDALTHSTKPDKLALIARNILLLPYQQKNLNHLTVIRQFALEYPNSGSLKRLLAGYDKHLRGTRNNDLRHYASTAYPIALDIALKNPSTYPQCTSIISVFLSAMKPNDRTKALEVIKRRMRSVPNTGILELWLQRLCAPIADAPREYSETLCKHCPERDQASNLWDTSWLRDDLKHIVANTSIVNRGKYDASPTSFDLSETTLFLDYSIASMGTPIRTHPTSPYTGHPVLLRMFLYDHERSKLSVR